MIRFSDSRRSKPNKLEASARTDREKKDLCLVLTSGACSQFVFKLEASARTDIEKKNLRLVLTPGACSQFVFKLEASARTDREEKRGHM